ncbi:MAG TPA: BrnT family toxin [Rhizomicrobium sp.]|jgi:uncharacterized DUF497 family protein|nr:BrnT family toxin [Rhizomicrobium sp.]
MEIEFDEAKSAKNERERGLPFALAALLFGQPRFEWEDRRKDYGEDRVSTLGEIEGRVFFATYTRRGKIVRIISFRKANAREIRRYRAAIGERSPPREG